MQKHPDAPDIRFTQSGSSKRPGQASHLRQLADDPTAHTAERYKPLNYCMLSFFSIISSN
jgi:hypothetical protein